MAWYRELEPVQEPFDFGLDVTGRRARWAFNIRSVKAFSATFLEEIAHELVTVGVLVSGEIFFGSKARLPDGDGPFLSIRETSGGPHERTHNTISPPAYVQPTAQLTIHALDPVLAQSKAVAIHNALNFRNKEVAT